MGACILTEARTLMILGAGKEQCEAINIALNLGLKVIALDQNPDSPGLKIAHVGIVTDINDVENIIELGRRYRIDGIMTHAVEIPCVVAKVAERLGLPGIPPDVAERATNKYLRIRCFTENGISCPKFMKVASPREAADSCVSLGFPVVFKPADNSGARGVIKVSRPVEIEDAFSLARSKSKLDYILVEEYLVGRELSTESLIYDGKIYTVAFADRNYDKIRFEPYFIEDGGQLPTDLSEDRLNDVIAGVDAAIRALGITWGVAKGDILIDDKGVRILEMAVRTSGGRFCSLKVPLSCGVNLLRPFILMSVGLKPDLKDLTVKFTRHVIERTVFANPGRIVSVSGLDDARNLDGIYQVELNEDIAPGHIVEKVIDHTKRIGYVISIDDDRARAIQQAETAVSLIRIVTDT